MQNLQKHTRAGKDEGNLVLQTDKMQKVEKSCTVWLAIKATCGDEIVVLG